MAYAHTRILHDSDVQETQGSAGQVGTVHKRHYIMPGEEVSQDDLGVDDATWAAYHREGVVGEEPLPDDLDYMSESPRQYRIRKAMEQLDALGTRPPEEEEEVPKALRPAGDTDTHGHDPTLAEDQ